MWCARGWHGVISTATATQPALLPVARSHSYYDGDAVDETTEGEECPEESVQPETLTDHFTNKKQWLLRQERRKRQPVAREIVLVPDQGCQRIRYLARIIRSFLL